MTSRAQIVAHFGTQVTPLACGPTHVVAVHHAHAELVVASRDGRSVHRHPLGGSPYGWRALSASGGRLWIGGTSGVARITLAPFSVERFDVPSLVETAANEHVCVLENGERLHRLDESGLHAIGTVPRSRLLAVTPTHALLGRPRTLVRWDLARGVEDARFATGGETFASSFAAHGRHVVVTLRREAASGPSTELAVLDESLAVKARWTWPGAAEQVVLSGSLVGVLLLTLQGAPVLQVRRLDGSAETTVPLSGPVGLGRSRATPDVVAVGDAIVALHDRVTAVLSWPTGLVHAHFAPEAVDPEWRRGASMLGALAAVDAAGRVLLLDPPATEPCPIELSTMALAFSTGGARAKVTYAGVTPVAIAQHPEHGRITFSQPTTGERLKTGDEVVLDEIDVKPGGVVTVLRWHRADARVAPPEITLLEWTFGVRDVRPPEPVPGPRVREAVDRAARELGPHHEALAVLASRLDGDAAFRHRFETLGVELDLRWAEDVEELQFLLELPPRRYFVFCRHVDEVVFYAVDREDQRLVELTTEDGAREPLPGPAGVGELWEERIAFMREAFDGDDEIESTLAALESDLDRGA